MRLRWGLAAMGAACMAYFGVAFAANEPQAERQAAPPQAAAPQREFVSLAGPVANGRHGPGEEHRIDWVYQREGLPMEVLGRSGPWRRVRDPDGGEVWMHAANLSDERTILVHNATGEALRLRSQPRPGARTMAILDNGVAAQMTGCQPGWRRVTVRGRVGWVEAAGVWPAGDCVGT